MCKTYQFSNSVRKQYSTFGTSKPLVTQRVLEILMDESRSDAAPVRNRCADFEGSDELREQLGAEALRENLPLAMASISLGKLSQNKYADATLSEARLNVASLLSGSQPASMVFALSSSFTSDQMRRLGANFPNTSPNDWPLGPAMAAYQIGACRTGLLGCGTGSIERDYICARFGECRAPDVESSYRRLFELYEIPFADTERLANKFQRAILARDANTLLP
jgi:hypothetical protein